IVARDQDLEVRVGRRAVEWIAIGLGEFSEDGIDRGFSGTERVLIAADADSFHSRWEVRAHAAAALAALLHRFRHHFFMTASGHERGGVRIPSHSQALKETAARHRHGIPPSATDDYRRVRVKCLLGKARYTYDRQLGEFYALGQSVSTK